MTELTPKLHIANPCFENWEKMLPEEQGRHCLKCKTTVTDFTDMTDQELIQFLSAHKGLTGCGRFRDDQVQTDPSQNYGFTLKLRHMFNLILFPLFTLFSTQTRASEKAVTEETKMEYRPNPGPTVSHYHPRLIHRKKHKAPARRMGMTSF
ncbi:MAG: hypothetical protein ACHQRM_17515 [Bacteroidia bacterium]